MKQSLQLKIGQSLKMTPQLQQAIRLLQLSGVELQTEVQEALESNMMLEIDESESEQKPSQETTTIESETKKDITDKVTDLNQETMPDELPVDSGWDDIYDSTSYFIKTASDKSNYDGFETKILVKHIARYLEEQLIWHK